MTVMATIPGNRNFLKSNPADEPTSVLRSARQQLQRHHLHDSEVLQSAWFSSSYVGVSTQMRPELGR